MGGGAKVRLSALNLLLCLNHDHNSASCICAEQLHVHYTVPFC